MGLQCHRSQCQQSEPAVTRYEVQPAHGVKVSKILALADDIKLNLAVADVRIEAPIPGKAAVGIEVPNKENSTVMFRELVESKEFRGAQIQDLHLRSVKISAETSWCRILPKCRIF